MLVVIVIAILAAVAGLLDEHCPRGSLLTG
jgi:hypothetical protein